MRKLMTALVIGSAFLAATEGWAQSRRSGPVRAPGGVRATGSVQAYQRRGDDRFSQPSGGSGIIRWNTPNASGNLGGPGTGGGSGNTN